MKDRALIGKFGDSHNDYDYKLIDPATLAVIEIDYEHSRVHAKVAYKCAAGQMVSDINDRTAIAIKTPNSPVEIHMVASAQVGTTSWFYIRESPTITDGQGATLPVYNRYRYSVNTSTVIDTSATPDLVGSATYFAEADQADYTEDGTLIHQELIGGGFQSRDGGNTRGRAEFVCKPNTAYLFYAKATTDNDTIQNINLDWYEITDKH